MHPYIVSSKVHQCDLVIWSPRLDIQDPHFDLYHSKDFVCDRVSKRGHCAQTQFRFGFMLSQSLSRFNGHFPGGHGLVDTRMSPFWILLELRMMVVTVTTGAIRCSKLQSNRHHQQTNTQLFTVRMSFLSPNQQRQSTEWKFMLSHREKMQRSLNFTLTTSTRCCL